MPKGKYTRKTEKRRPGRIGLAVLALALFLLVLGVATGAVQDTLAYLFTTDDAVENVFLPGEVKIQVVESLTDGGATAVSLHNVGTVDAYVRAMVVVTWQDSNGKVHPEAPVENEDYTISWNTGDWTPPASGEDFYSYQKKLAPETYSAVLFSGCAQINGRAPEDCHLVVDVIAEAVQANDYGLAGWSR